MVDVSSQSCTITPTSPDGLDPTGGVLVGGTVNVMIECRSMNNDGSLPNRLRWFDPNMARLKSVGNTPVGDPPNNN